ncbi:hypothetical protein D915_006725 [Fasciola hepatica]|uniref:Nuclear protein MDM1 n=1 Tax=Fasciola hepatica TaxID=6192 RepID=A0A2H1C5C7_FASHE|nr:hypothetical protein D915_006725 [Fasciola hepatica]
MVKIERESLEFKQQNNFGTHKRSKMSYAPQDDFFIIGPSNTRLAPSIAYPNSLRNRSRSTSPGIVRFQQDKRRSMKINPERIKQASRDPTTTNSIINCGVTKPAPFVSIKTTNTRHDEASQTDAPRKALEAEIQRIRSDLEQRKRRLRESRDSLPKNRKNTPPRRFLDPTEPATPKPVEVVPSMRGTSETPFAPRSDPPQHPRISRVEQERRQRSASPIGRSHQTEYQRAYRTPEMRQIRSAQPTGRPRIARAQTESSLPIKYESEYQREYKPFKYVPVEKLKTTSLQEHDGVHIVPIPRPRSAINLLSMEPKKNKKTQQRVRSFTPPTDGDQKRKRRYKTEYVAKYKNFSQPVSRGPSPTHTYTKSNRHKCFEEWDRTRQQADHNRERDRGSHFDPHHFSQLDSACVNCWDPPSTPSYEVREKMRAHVARPPAGKPSNLNEDLKANPGNWMMNKRREAMYNSHRVAEVLDIDESWDDSSSETDIMHKPTSNARTSQYNQPNPVSTTEQQNHQLRERLCSMFPQGQIRGLRSNSPDKPIHDSSHNPVSTSNASSLIEDVSSGSSLYETNGHWVHTADRDTEDRARKNLLPTTMDIDPTVSFSTPSPLSVRSMASNASIASETLERAKRRRDRMLCDYDSRLQYTYSPSAYSGSKHQSEH